jgi:2'-hydroxyisoflavone reductase
MKLLLIGGNGDESVDVVGAAVRRGHEVTLFGNTKEATRAGEVELLPNRWLWSDEEWHFGKRRWDAAIAYVDLGPDKLAKFAPIISGLVDMLIWQSTIGVGDIENSPLKRDYLAAEAPELPDSRYSEMQLANEYCLTHSVTVPLTVVRPASIVGRFEAPRKIKYWLQRIKEEGEVLAPGDKNRPIDMIDSDDLAYFYVTLAENRTFGTFDAIGPAEPATMGQLLEACRAIVGGLATFTWVSDSFLVRQMPEDQKLPLWEIPTLAEYNARTAEVARAAESGFRASRLAVTVQRALDAMDLHFPQDTTNQLDRQTETMILREWHKLSQPYAR